MARLREVLAAVAPRDCTVMIHGESGSGKELAARTIHALSPRAAAPFIAVDCTGLRDTLLESQLFGHVKGAFTGADQPSLGFIRAADGGTLFLDEIGELEAKTQAKLLRVLQERAVVPLGSTKPVPVDLRVVCASHRDLRAMTARGEFREDLLFRLDVVKVLLPALRERREDILSLADHFISQIAGLYGETSKIISDSARLALETYAWPGNVRELANALEHAVVFCRDGVVTASDLPERVRGSVAPTTYIQQGSLPTDAVMSPMAPIPTLEAMERDLISQALRATNGNQNQAAAMLDIERRRLYRKIARYGLRSMVNQRAV